MFVLVSLFDLFSDIFAVGFVGVCLYLHLIRSVCDIIKLNTFTFFCLSHSFAKRIVCTNFSFACFSFSLLFCVYALELDCLLLCNSIKVKFQMYEC